MVWCASGATEDDTMSEHLFTLVLQGNLDSDEIIDALYEAGCDDATFGTVDHAGYADFARDAPSFGEAVSSAIADVESVPGPRSYGSSPPTWQPRAGRQLPQG